MSCSSCEPLIQRAPEDRERRELEGSFEIIEETHDKYDAGTLWNYGKARCLRCKQQVEFSYMCGSQSTGRLTLY